MSTKTKPTETNANASAEAIAAAAAAQKAKADELRAKVEAEVNALHEAFKAYAAAAMALGNQGLELLAREVGESVDTNGRPAFGAWHRFNSTLALAKVDFTTHDRLLRIARRNVPANVKDEKADKFVKAKARGTYGKSSCSLTMQSPVAWDIALGE